MKRHLTLFFKVLGIIAFFALMLVFFMGGPGRFVQDPHGAMLRERFIRPSFSCIGENIYVRDSILNVIREPERYRHVMTERRDLYLDTLQITTLFTAIDSVGERSFFRAKATVSIDGKITKLTISQE